MPGQRGGARPRAGRKPKPTIPASVSQEHLGHILKFLENATNPHWDAADKDGKQQQKCWCQFCRMWALSRAADPRLRYSIERALLQWQIGLPAKAAPKDNGKTNGASAGNGGQNMRVVVEFIGRDTPDDDPQPVAG